MIHGKQKHPKVHIKEEELVARKDDNASRVTGPPLRDRTLQQTHGNLLVQKLFEGSLIQTKLYISSPGDTCEQEADRIAHHVVSMSANDVEQKKGIAAIQEIHQPGPGYRVNEIIETKIQAFSRQGEPLEKQVRDYYEPRFGVDLGNVRIHKDSQADTYARAVQARAFTMGNTIVFAENEYRPETYEGKKLLAHELTHVIQQGKGEENKYASVYPLIQRTTHGPGTPTNAHNWRIPLPPWIAGTIAHGQIVSYLGIPSVGIPRASKAFKTIPNPPAIVPYGIADLWNHTGSQVNIAEIKSTSTGSIIAQAEAQHYIRRHNQWVSRFPFTATHDRNYFQRVGGLLPGGILDLSSRTGTDLPIGPFWGDPMKILHIEADNLGALVYWCTGQGLPFSPVWYPVLKRMLDELRNLMREIKELIDSVIEGVRPVIEWIQGFINSIVTWGAEHSKVLAFIFLVILLIVAIVLLILSILAEPASGGTSTAGVYASAMAAIFILVGLGALIGINANKLPEATGNLALTLFPDEGTQVNGADYEKRTNTAKIPLTREEASQMVNTYDPVGEFLAAAQPFLNPLDVVGGIFSSMDSVPSQGIARLNEGADFLATNGDPTTANYVRTIMSSSGLG
jgi:hypothetical protein